MKAAVNHVTGNKHNGSKRMRRVQKGFDLVHRCRALSNIDKIKVNGRYILIVI